MSQLPLTSKLSHLQAAPHRGPIAPSVFLLASAVLLSLLLIFVVAPILQFYAQPGPIRPGAFDSRMPLYMFLQQGAMNGFTLVWFFAVGASFGSFMNVVTWRMPRRMNFVSQSSICPKCRHAIRGRHNLPVIGWIMLGGRCYDCGEPISFRYPLVELYFGGAAFILCAWEIATGGWNLPLHTEAARFGFYETLWTPRWDLIVVFAFHFCLFIWLLTICLFEIDEEATPRRFALFAILLVTIVSFIVPVVQPVSWLFTETLAAKPSPVAPERFSGVIGLLLGALIALPTAFANPSPRAYAINVVLAVSLIGGHLGWQAAVSALVLANLLTLLLGNKSTTVATITFAALLQILAWRWLHQLQWDFGILGIATWVLLAAFTLTLLPNRALLAEPAK